MVNVYFYSSFSTTLNKYGIIVFSESLKQILYGLNRSVLAELSCFSCFKISRNV